MEKLEKIKFAIMIATFLQIMSFELVYSQANFICTAPGRYPNLQNCCAYYLCTPLPNGSYYQSNMTCPKGLCFDSYSRQCTKPANANCAGVNNCATCSNTSATTSTTTSTTTQTPNQCTGPGFFCNSQTQYTFCADVNVPIPPAQTCPDEYFCNPKCVSPCLNDITHC